MSKKISKDKGNGRKLPKNTTALRNGATLPCRAYVFRFSALCPNEIGFEPTRKGITREPQI